MAEIRKFIPGAGGEIRQALARAMGEPVRPITPGDGEPPRPKPKTSPASPTVTSGVIWDPFLKTTPAKALKKNSLPRADDPSPAVDEA